MKENHVNGTTSSFHSNSQVSSGDLSSLTFGQSISGIQKKGERELIENMYLNDIQHNMLDKYQCTELLRKGLDGREQLNDLLVKVLQSQTNASFIKFKTECEDQEGIYDEEERNADMRIAAKDGELATSIIQVKDSMRSIQEDEDEEMRQVKAKYDESRRLVKLRQTTLEREIEEEKERCRNEKVRSKEEKEKISLFHWHTYVPSRLSMNLFHCITASTYKTIKILICRGRLTTVVACWSVCSLA